MDLKLKKLDINEKITISYLDNEAIDKKILVFVHGWGADKYNLQRIYNQLLDNYRIISIDLPGFGESTTPEEICGSIEYAGYLNVFFTKNNLSNINYIGHSFGGKIGIILSVFYPSLIKRLILIDSAGLRNKRYLNWYIKVGVFKFVKIIFNKILKKTDFFDKIKNKMGSEDYKNAGNLRSIMVKTVNEDFSHLIKKVGCPVFLYWGEKDKDTPLWMAKKMKKLINDSALYIVKNGGHFSFLDDNRIISIIKSFAV